MNTADRLDNPVHHKSVITSQWGEDGIVAEIFQRIGIKYRWCIEFGAWDGKYLSNTWQLWHELKWASVLLEGDPGRARALAEQTASRPAVKVINRFVRDSGADKLDRLLAEADVPATIDLLSIDIDGDDYYILESCELYLPRVLIVEYNPTIPPFMDIVQARGEYFGASARAVTRMARSKGYGLVCLTESNCIFVLQSEYEKLGISEPDLAEVFPSDHLTYVITAQNGATFLSRIPTYFQADARIEMRARLRHLFRPRRHYPKLLSQQALIQADIDPVQATGPQGVQ